MRKNTQIKCFGSYKDVNIKDCLSNKLQTLVVDEFHLPQPICISLVIPTKIDVTKQAREQELRVMEKVFSECSQLVDMGYLDEIVVIDGSLDEKRNSDFHVLDQVAEKAYDELDLFQRQVQLINAHKAQALNAERGYFKFILKTIHQFDPNILSLFNQYGLNKSMGFPQIPMGKGVALWLSIPITNGDIVCFIDSDIMNFKKEFIITLCEPLIRSYQDSSSQIKLVKASYERLTVSFNFLGSKYFFGGRVTRLYAIPILKVLAKYYPELFMGLNTLRYPLSGECAIRKDLLTNIKFPNNYSIEISVLQQVAHSIGLNQMGQVDLDVLHHIGQSKGSLDKMVTQITNYIVHSIREKKGNISNKVKKIILNDYRQEGNTAILKYLQVFKELIQKEDTDYSKQLLDTQNMDKEMFKGFLIQVKKSFTESTTNNQFFIFPSWSQLSKKHSYFMISTLLRRLGNQSTFNRLKSTNLYYDLQ